MDLQSYNVLRHSNRAFTAHSHSDTKNCLCRQSLPSYWRSALFDAAINQGSPESSPFGKQTINHIGITQVSHQRILPQSGNGTDRRDGNFMAASSVSSLPLPHAMGQADDIKVHRRTDAKYSNRTPRSPHLVRSIRSNHGPRSALGHGLRYWLPSRTQGPKGWQSS